MSIATLLAVEDNKIHQYVIRRFCEMFEYDVHIVSSAEEALSAVGIANYAAILMDITLPNMSGLECARLIREEERRRGKAAGIPIIALTAAESDQLLWQEAGMNDYLSKPFDPEDLRRVLLRWVYQPARPNLKILENYKPRPEDVRLWHEG